MKKSIFAVLSLALLWTGCTNELNLAQGEDGETVKVTVNTVLEQAGKSTRAVWDNDGNGACVNHWIMEVYDAQGQLFDRQEKTKQKGLKNSFEITLIKNQSYQFAFWADTKGMYDTEDLREVKTVKHKAGLDKRDAFFAEVDYTSTKSETLTAKLYRPFAQVNVVTLDLAKLYSQMEKAGTTADYDKFIPQTIKLKTTTYNKFNVLTGEVDSVETYALKIDTCYADYSAHEAQTTIFMDYGFAADKKEVKDMKFSFISNGEEISYNFTNIPVQRNYRTNISGNLLSNDATWNVEIIPVWEEPDYEVPYYVATSIKDAQDYITHGTDGTKEVDLTSAIITDDDINADDKTIHFVLTENSPEEIVNFTLPAIPAELAGCEGWTIESSKDGYPTKNVGVNAPEGTKVVINTPSSHVTVTGTNYAQIIASTAGNTLVISEGVTVKELIVKKGAVEIHGNVKKLKVEPEQGDSVCFRACERLSAKVFGIVKGYIDPWYTFKQNEDATYDIVKRPVAAMIGEVEYPSITDAIAAVQANETIEIFSDIALDSPITISKSNFTINGNNYTIAVSDAEYWNQYKVGEDNQGFGKCNMISVKGSDFTLKDVTLDGKDCRGVSLCTTSGGKDVLYQNVIYTGRGSGHYYGEATGLVTFDGCKFDTHGYAVHFGGESSVDDDVVIKNCELNGWSSFGSCKSLTISDSHFGGANDEGKNGWLAVLRPYCPTIITNCTFSDIYLHEAVDGYEYIGLGTGAATTVILNGCKIVNDSKQETDAAIYSIVRDNGFDNEAAQEGSVFAFDAIGDATNGFTAGTFYAKDYTKIKPAASFVVKPVQDKENIWTIEESVE